MSKNIDCQDCELSIEYKFGSKCMGFLKLKGRCPQIHTLKTWSNLFMDVVNGIKNFDLRKNDRDFRVDDILVLKEWNKNIGYSGDSIKVKIIYFLGGGDFGLDKEYCVLGIEEVSD